MAFFRPRVLLPVLLALLIALVATSAAVAKGGKFRGHLAVQRSLGKAKERTATRRPILWGALVSDQLTGHQAPWDMGGPRQLEAMLGKRMSLIHFMAPFAHCSEEGCGYYDFPAEEMQTIRNHGSIPFFSWSSQSIPSSESQPDYQLADVASGRYDGYIRQWARDARRWGQRFFLRFNWEMNGDWFPWAEGANGNRPGDYVRAWRHVHDVFDEVGADNAIWRCFDQLYRLTYDEVVKQIAPTKPMVLGDIASTEQGGSKAQWIADMLRDLPTEYPKVRGLVWFDKFENGMDWPIETSQSAIEAFATGIRAPRFVAGSS